MYKCLPGCSQHGTYDLDSGKCICDKHWTGADCSQRKCAISFESLNLLSPHLDNSECFQRLAVWIAVLMVLALRVDANVRLDGLEPIVSNYRATKGVQLTDSARTAHVFAPKDGTENIAHYVSILFI